MNCYQYLPSELRTYYEKRSKGLIEARPNDYWGPETPEETAKWQQWWAPIRKNFRPIDWNAGFTGRGGEIFSCALRVVSCNANGGTVVKTEKAMEVPGLVGPMGEKLPVLGEIMWEIEESMPVEAEEGRESTKRKRRLTEVATEIYKQARGCCRAYIEKHIEKRGLATGKSRERY